MILLNEKVFYYHVPKTGGTSIEKFLLSFYGYEPFNLTTFTYGLIQESLLEPPYGNSWTVQSVAHLPFTQLVEIANRSKAEIDSSWNIFTVVRNPYERLSSAIYFQPGMGCQEHLPLASSDQERRFIFNKAQKAFFTSDPNYNNWFNHRVPQTDLLDFGIKYPVEVYKYEEGLESILLNQFKEKLPSSIKLEQTNKSNINYQELWSVDFISNVNKLYAEDFKRFDYQMLDPNTFPKSW